VVDILRNEKSVYGNARNKISLLRVSIFVISGIILILLFKYQFISFLLINLPILIYEKVHSCLPPGSWKAVEKLTFSSFLVE
jgi:hypothetical protein